MPKTTERKTGRGDARKLRVALARAAGGSKLAVAREEGVNERTIYNWERFDVTYQGFYRECLAEIKTDGLAEAMNVLRAALRPEAPPRKPGEDPVPIPMHTRLRAASIIVQSADRNDTVTGSFDVTHGGAVQVIKVPERKRNG